MTVRLSTQLRNNMLGAVGFQGSFGSCFINIYTGSQPTTADTGATGTLLGTASVNGAGTGQTFAAPSLGVITKTLAEVWRFTGLAAGVAGWFRLWQTGDTVTNTSTTNARLDGSIGTSGADLNLANLTIAVSQVNTIDTFTFTMPGQ